MAAFQHSANLFYKERIAGIRAPFNAVEKEH
jgi:hypothetical protein